MTKPTKIDTTDLFEASKEARKRSLDTTLPSAERAASKVLLDKLVEHGYDHEKPPTPPAPPTKVELKAMIDVLLARVEKLEVKPKNGNGNEKGNP